MTEPGKVRSAPRGEWSEEEQEAMAQAVVFQLKGDTELLPSTSNILLWGMPLDGWRRFLRHVTTAPFDLEDCLCHQTDGELLRFPQMRMFRTAVYHTAQCAAGIERLGLPVAFTVNRLGWLSIKTVWSDSCPLDQAEDAAALAVSTRRVALRAITIFLEGLLK